MRGLLVCNQFMFPILKLMYKWQKDFHFHWMGKLGFKVDFSVDDIERLGYAGSTNSKGGAGLIPVSTVGAMDTRASRMILFENQVLLNTWWLSNNGQPG